MHFLHYMKLTPTFLPYRTSHSQQTILILSTLTALLGSYTFQLRPQSLFFAFSIEAPTRSSPSQFRHSPSHFFRDLVKNFFLVYKYHKELSLCLLVLLHHRFTKNFTFIVFFPAINPICISSISTCSLNCFLFF